MINYMNFTTVCSLFKQMNFTQTLLWLVFAVLMTLNPTNGLGVVGGSGGSCYSYEELSSMKSLRAQKDALYRELMIHERSFVTTLEPFGIESEISCHFGGEEKKVWVNGREPKRCDALSLEKLVLLRTTKICGVEPKRAIYSVYKGFVKLSTPCDSAVLIAAIPPPTSKDRDYWECGNYRYGDMPNEYSVDVPVDYEPKCDVITSHNEEVLKRNAEKNPKWWQ